jgi:hypothetical protein
MRVLEYLLNPIMGKSVVIYLKKERPSIVYDGTSISGQDAFSRMVIPT